MLGTFGTERNEKIIRKNLQLFRNTLVETFEIAKLLRMNAVGSIESKSKNYSGALLVGTLGATAGLTLPKLLLLPLTIYSVVSEAILLVPFQLLANKSSI